MTKTLEHGGGLSTHCVHKHHGRSRCAGAPFFATTTLFWAEKTSSCFALPAMEWWKAAGSSACPTKKEPSILSPVPSEATRAHQRDHPLRGRGVCGALRPAAGGIPRVLAPLRCRGGPLPGRSFVPHPSRSGGLHAEGRKMPGITFNCVSRGPQSSRRRARDEACWDREVRRPALAFLACGRERSSEAEDEHASRSTSYRSAARARRKGLGENKTSKDQRGRGAAGSKGSGRLAHRSPVTREFGNGGRGACADVCQAHVCQYCLQPHPNSECDPMTKRRQAGQVTFQAQDLWQHGQGHGHRDQGQGAHRHRLRQGQRGHWREWQDELQDAPGTGAVPGLGHIWHGRRAEHGSTHPTRVKQWRSSPPAAATTAALALSGPSSSHS